VQAGHDVHLIVADGKQSEVKNGVNIHDMGLRGGLKNRLLKTNKKILEKAVSLNGDYYFFHDPELCIQALKLSKHGKKVIYDAHEDSPRQFFTNAQGSKLKAKLIANFLERLEHKTARKIYGMLTATEGIQDRYKSYNSNIEVVKNYPKVEELINDIKWGSRADQACYVGGLRNTRGISEIVKACSNSNLKLKLAGPWQPLSYQKELEKSETYKVVDYLGFLNRNAIKSLLSNSKVGMLTLYKTENHLHSLPVKLYEYMIAGIPVIASDIPLWKEIIEENHCGICIDPHNVDAIENAIKYILENPAEAEKMGENGKNAVIQKFSWNNEFIKILKMIN